MLLLLGIALPLAILGFGMSDDGDDGDITEPNVEGTDDADVLDGEQGIDFIDGLEGDDIMNGRAGGDLILGRGGEDILQGADGNDTLCSGDDDDIVMGNLGSDFIEGMEGDDFVSGDYGFDTVDGNEGNDTVIGGRSFDVVSGNAGDDVVFGGVVQNLPLSIDEMVELRDGGSLSDINGGINLRDDSVGNVLSGGEGDDDLILGGDDVATGDEGADTFHIMSEQNGQVIPLISDYNGEEDSLTVIVDDVDTDEEITVRNQGGNAVIRLGDTVVARVTGAGGTLTAADVSLISEAEVAQLFEINPVGQGAAAS